MIRMMLWYADRYRDERRRQRAMTRGMWQPWTGRMALVCALLMGAVALWVLFPPAALGEATYTVTVSDYCNVRERPDKGSADVGDLYASDTVQGLDYSQGWVLVSAPVEAGQGWVRADLLTLADYPSGRYTNTSGGRVYIRTEPDGDHSGWLKAGGTVDVLRWVDASGAWAYTSKGYIDGQYLELEEESK